ncbi:MAG: flagellar basal body-associated FliL family protein [Pseudomonadota bacterium]
MKFILPVIFALLGATGGLFGGHMLKPPPEEDPSMTDGSDQASSEAMPDAEMAEDDPTKGQTELAGYEKPQPVVSKPENTKFVKLEKQFVVPVIEGRRVASLMVLSLAVEVNEDAEEAVFSHEPKLRDELLRALFVHAQSGGFSGQFTKPHLMDDLKASLGVAARQVLGDVSYEVLLTNIVRQDQ